MTLKFKTLIYCTLLLSSLFLQSTVIADDKEETTVATASEDQQLIEFEQRYQKELEEEKKWKKEQELEQKYQQYLYKKKLQEGDSTATGYNDSQMEASRPVTARPVYASTGSDTGNNTSQAVAPPAPKSAPNHAPSNDENTSEPQTTETSWWSTQNAMTISVVVLIFGLLFIFMLARMVKKEDSTTEELMKLFLIPLIIIMGVFLVVAGYSDTQITPVMTLLGTIIGFLFGTKPKPNSEEESPEPNKPAKPLESSGDK